MAVVVRVALGIVLGLAAGSKLRAPRDSAAGLATFGIPARLRLPGVLLLAAVEAALAVGVASGSHAAAYAAAALVAAFGVVVVVALARGAAGAPCACFGARSRVGVGALVRNIVLATALAASPLVPSRWPSRDGWLLVGLVGLVAAFAAIVGLTIAVLALARELGMLRLRLAPESALDIAGEGPPLGAEVRLPRILDRRPNAALALAVFSSDGCALCQRLRPVVAAFARDPHVAVEIYDEVRDAALWHDLRIPGSPFAVAVDRSGSVRAKGTFNSYGQLESILASAERAAGGLAA